MISHENIASRAVVFESYDKQVQGRTIIESGMSDAGVMAPFKVMNTQKKSEKLELPFPQIIIQAKVK